MTAARKVVAALAATAAAASLAACGSQQSVDQADGVYRETSCERWLAQTDATRSRWVSEIAPNEGKGAVERYVAAINLACSAYPEMTVAGAAESFGGGR